ncbi:TonB-dependent receptor [Paraburkholderia unamae]|nr:TonB-dependent receptor [Paraburkholderia unamae]
MKARRKSEAGNTHTAAWPPFRRRTCLSSLLIGPMMLGVTAMCAQAQTATVPAQADKSTESGAQKSQQESQKKIPQQHAAKNAATNQATLNTVEVTANRRREPARDVPMQLNIVNTENLQRAGATRLDDYVSSEPGVVFSNGGGTGSGSLEIRGVTTGQQVTPTVGVYIDDVAFGSSAVFGLGSQFALDMGLLDLNHIEVLRGPQGTLYGAGAMGGLLKYVTNEPDPGGFYGSAGVGGSFTEHGGFNNTVNAVVNVPLKTDVAALRISAFNNHDAGDVNAIGPAGGSNVNRGNTTGARASLLVTPTDKLTLRFTATTQNINRDGSDFIDYGLNGQPLYGDLTRKLYTPEPFHQGIQLYSAGVEYDFGWARLNSTTSWQSIHTDSMLDYSSAYLPSFNSLGLGLDAVTSPTQVSSEKFTQEVRLTSPSNRTLEWIAGLYYTQEHDHTFTGVNGVQAGGASLNLQSADIPSSYREYAAFGDLTYHATSRLALTAGVRVAHNSQDFTQSLSGLLFGAPASSSASSDDTTATYMFTARYALTPQSNVYVRAASGYRPGGPNTGLLNPLTGLPAAAAPTFKPDTLWSYEAGYKADLFDKRLSLSVTGYDILWHDIQQINSSGGFNTFINAGNAEIRGLELSSTLRPTNRWTFGANLNLSTSRLLTGSALAGTVAGESLPVAPRISASLLANYRFMLAGNPAYAGVQERFIGNRDSAFVTSNGTPNYHMPGYAITDLQAGVSVKHVDVAFFVRNLFDKRAITSANAALTPLGGPVWVTVAQPRTIGVNLSTSF